MRDRNKLRLHGLLMLSKPHAMEASRCSDGIGAAVADRPLRR